MVMAAASQRVPAGQKQTMGNGATLTVVLAGESVKPGEAGVK